MLALNQRAADLSPFGVAIDDLKAQLHTSFSSYDVISCVSVILIDLHMN
jgi:hypothetical protein